MTTAASETTITVVDGVTAEPSGERIIILNGEGTAMTTLNPMGSLIWQRLSVSATVADLIQSVQDEFPAVESEVIAGDIASFVSDLDGLGLVTIATGPGQAR